MATPVEFVARPGYGKFCTLASSINLIAGDVALGHVDMRTPGACVQVPVLNYF